MPLSNFTINGRREGGKGEGRLVALPSTTLILGVNVSVSLSMSMDVRKAGAK